MRVAVFLPRASVGRYDRFLRHLEAHAGVTCELFMHDTAREASVGRRVIAGLVRSIIAFETFSKRGRGASAPRPVEIAQTDRSYDTVFCVGMPPANIGEIVPPDKPVFAVHDASDPCAPGFARVVGAAGGLCSQLSVDIFRHDLEVGSEPSLCEQVVVRGRLKLSDNVDIVQKIQATYLAIAARRALGSPALEAASRPAAAEVFPILSDPPLGAALGAYLSSVFAILTGQVLSRFRKPAHPSPKWRVFFSPARDKAEIAPEGHETALPQPSDRFFADPFLIHHHDTTYCFVEEEPEGAPKAHIAGFELPPEKPPRALGPVLALPYHLSFPLVFEHDGRVFMCPETAKSGRVQLFESRNMPYDWDLVREWDLGAPAVDPLIFRHDGRWWMFVGFDRADCGEYCSDLSIFYCDDLIRNDWTPHAANPISNDCRYSRNGGWLVRPGGLPIRVGQYQTTRIYGRAMSLFEIDELTPMRYSETLLRHERDLGGFHSAHHMSAIPQGYCFDARC